MPLNLSTLTGFNQDGIVGKNTAARKGDRGYSRTSMYLYRNSPGSGQHGARPQVVNSCDRLFRGTKIQSFRSRRTAPRRLSPAFRSNGQQHIVWCCGLLSLTGFNWNSYKETLGQALLSVCRLIEIFRDLKPITYKIREVLK